MNNINIYFIKFSYYKGDDMRHVTESIIVPIAMENLNKEHIRELCRSWARRMSTYKYFDDIDIITKLT